MFLQMNPQRQEGNREKVSRTPSNKNYDFTMFWSRISASHGIAVKWFLKVYWLLPLSTVDSFAENRRFFCRAPTILLLRTDASFAEHRWFFCWAPMILLLGTDDSFAGHRWLLGPFNQLHFPKEGNNCMSILDTPTIIVTYMPYSWQEIMAQ